jgi:hypothetical protein
MNWIDRFKNVFGSASETLPNFLGIGAQRAGTTWLHKMLIQHHDIYASATKELHFFDERPNYTGYQGIGSPDQRFYYNLNSTSHWRWYKRQFKQAENANIVGEITPFYATLSEQRVSYIAEKLHHPKIIYILRNPIQRAWSAFRRAWFLETGHTNDDFDTDVTLKTIMYPAKLIHGDYIRNTSIYEKIFGVDRILYLFYDDIVRKPSDVLHQIWTFFKVAPLHLSEPEIHKKVNTAPGFAIPGPIENVLAQYYGDQMFFIKQKFNRTLVD